MRKKSNEATDWTPLHFAVLVFGTFGGHFIAAKGPEFAPVKFLIPGSALGFLFSMLTAFFRLKNRTEQLSFERSIWTFPPTDPIGNCLGQAVFFTAIGITIVVENVIKSRSLFGLLFLSIGLGIISALTIYRLRSRTKNSHR